MWQERWSGQCSSGRDAAGVMTAQCGKCQQGQWQPWAVAAMVVVGVSVVVVLTARHQDGDSVEDGMVSRKVIGSSSGGVGHSSDPGKAAFSHWTHGSTGTVWTVVLRKRVGTNDFGKAVTCSKDTRGQGRDG